MKHQFAFDLKVQRRRSGLSQVDIAHLLGCDRSHLSKLERGERQPLVAEVVALSIILGRSSDSLLAGMRAPVSKEVGRRLETLPRPKSDWINTFIRQVTLTDLAERLSTNADPGYDSA